MTGYAFSHAEGYSREAATDAALRDDDTPENDDTPTTGTVRVLTGHTSPETAYIVDDYPYGFRLRCQMRHWLEHRKGHGFRHVTQTSNPKRPGTWNKPKAGTYAPLLVLVVDHQDHVTSQGAGLWRTEAELDAYEATYGAAFTEEHRAALRYLRAANRASKRITYTIQPNDGTPRQTMQEQAALFGAVVADELRRTA